MKHLSTFQKMAMAMAVIWLVLLFFASPLMAQKKITICHVPPGNPENAETIEIPEPALQAHLAHGDYTGECISTTDRPMASCQNKPAGDELALSQSPCFSKFWNEQSGEKHQVLLKQTL